MRSSRGGFFFFFYCKIEEGRGQDRALRCSAADGEGVRRLTVESNNLGAAIRKKISDIVKEARAWLSFLKVVEDDFAANVIECFFKCGVG